jgi:hypothetical protein
MGMNDQLMKELCLAVLENQRGNDRCEVWCPYCGEEPRWGREDRRWHRDDCLVIKAARHLGVDELDYGW